MPTLRKPACILSIILITAGTAWADSSHNDGDASLGNGAGAISVGGSPHQMMRDMMQMMMSMHGFGPDWIGLAGPGTGMAGSGYGIGMMDRDMMRMMMGPDMMVGMVQGMPRQMMQAQLEEYDTDGDGALRLDEFAGWHAAMMRAQMVDRFQHLDANGDGRVTGDELDALAGRIDNGPLGDGPRTPARPGMNGMNEQN